MVEDDHILYFLDSIPSDFTIVARICKYGSNMTGNKMFFGG